MSIVTLLVPTKNRTDFITRLLYYYWSTDFQGFICIGDSSDSIHIKQTKSVIAVFQDKLNIIYREYPNLTNIECIQKLLDTVSTAYVAFVADDDFLIPATIKKCVHFLESHPDYIAASGIGILTNLRSGGAYGEVISASYYRLPVITEESAPQRLLNHLKNYSVALFSVHRTESWRLMCRDVATITDSIFTTELLPCCLSVIGGKIKKLDYLYLVRQDHPQRYQQPDVFDWITNHNWSPSYLVFRDCLAEKLVQMDGIGLHEAQEVVKQAFWAYLARAISSKWQAKYVPLQSSVWRNIVKRAPGVHLLRRALYALKPTPFSLSALLKLSSPYHADFMPVYRAFTTTPADMLHENLKETA